VSGEWDPRRMGAASGCGARAWYLSSPAGGGSCPCLPCVLAMDAALGCIVDALGCGVLAILDSSSPANLEPASSLSKCREWSKWEAESMVSDGFGFMFDQ
jgi:hypothetical protein